MEYSKDNIMTRKEYLKSKKKNNVFISKIKYFLLILVVIALGIYVFKQLNVYNNVTKIANKVVEETKLARTMTMYYVSEPYTKDGPKNVMLYRASDESRTNIPDSENFTKIQVLDNKLYGICDNLLYTIDLTTYNKEKVIDKQIQDYVIKGNNIYLKDNDGIYKYDLNSQEISKIIMGKTDKLLVDNNNIFVIAEGKTSQSIIRYNLNGQGAQQLSEKYIVANMYLQGDTIYFINSKDLEVYGVPKVGAKIDNIIDNKVQQQDGLLFYKEYIYYINKDDSNTLYVANLKNGEHKQVIKKNISKIQIDGSIIYYSLSNSIGIYKYDIQSGKTAQITSARTSEYICIN